VSARFGATIDGAMTPSPRARGAMFAALLASSALSSACGPRGDHPPMLADPLPDAAGDDVGALDAGGADPPGALGALVSTTSPNLWEYETEVTVAPNGRDAFAIWMIQSLGYHYDLGYAISSDGGATWSTPRRVPATPYIGVNASVTADAEGVFQLTWLETAPRRRVMAATYYASGDSFSIPKEISDASSSAAFDKPWIVALADDSLLVAFGTDSGTTLTVAKSVDHGVTWSRTTIAPDSNLRNVVFPCASGARVHVAYLVPSGVELVTSEDYGATFGAPVRVDVPGDTAFEPPSCVADGDDVWVAYGVGGGVGSTWQMALLDAVWVAHSSDRGHTIARRTRASDPAEGRHQLLPRLGRTEAGSLALGYYVGDVAGAPGRFRVAFSDAPNRGDAWTTRVTVAKPAGLQPARGQYDTLGDYVGMHASGDGVLVSFADNASVPGAALSHVRIARVPHP
jgi:hypothetical protein